MRSGGNNFKYFSSENKLTKLANLVEFKCMLIFCLEDWPSCLWHWTRKNFRKNILANFNEKMLQWDVFRRMHILWR